ncbi:MAG: ribosome recycling factor [Betaproteobacteria bacterium]|nr:ribosome recycling factor [Betaproteobacteria bacterium]
MSPSEIRPQVEQKMVKAIDSLKHVLSRIRTGRAHAGLLEHVHVDYYGSQVPLSQVANITVLDARTLGVSVWEKKMATVVDKAIREADLGLNPISSNTALATTLTLANAKLPTLTALNEPSPAITFRPASDAIAVDSTVALVPVPPKPTNNVLVTASLKYKLESRKLA